MDIYCIIHIKPYSVTQVDWLRHLKVVGRTGSYGFYYQLIFYLLYCLGQITEYFCPAIFENESNRIHTVPDHMSIHQMSVRCPLLVTFRPIWKIQESGQ